MLGEDTTTEYLTATNTFPGFNPSFNVHSAVGGLHGGYNYQIGSAVLGIESDIEAANINGGFAAPAVGFTADKVLFYGTGGLAFADISHTYTNLIPGVPEATASLRTGWTAGAGVEVALTPKLLARVEYRYTDYGPYRYDSVTSFPGFTGQQEPRFSTIRVGAAYKF
jgi:outer membrane immunogenic protein